MFLRGQAFRHGDGVTIKQFEGNAVIKKKKIVESIKELHDKENVPYDEIAVTMYNRQYIIFSYFLESALLKALSKEHIPYNCLYNDGQSWAGHFGDGGVSLITFDSVLGLDFQAVIVCGIKPLGAYDRTKKLRSDGGVSEEEIQQIKKNISYLYVACTRAKDYLHIILGESSNESIYNKLLTDSKN